MKFRNTALFLSMSLLSLNANAGGGGGASMPKVFDCVEAGNPDHTITVYQDLEFFRQSELCFKDEKVKCIEPNGYDTKKVVFQSALSDAVNGTANYFALDTSPTGPTVNGRGFLLTFRKGQKEQTATYSCSGQFR